MMCRVRGCGTEGLFHETDGYCPRCYEEVEETYNIPDSTGYYERKQKKREEILPYLAWLAGITFVIWVARSLWLMFFTE